MNATCAGSASVTVIYGGVRWAVVVHGQGVDDLAAGDDGGRSILVQREVRKGVDLDQRAGGKMLAGSRSVALVDGRRVEAGPPAAAMPATTMVALAPGSRSPRLQGKPVQPPRLLLTCGWVTPAGIESSTRHVACRAWPGIGDDDTVLHQVADQHIGGSCTLGNGKQGQRLHGRGVGGPVVGGRQLAVGAAHLGQRWPPACLSAAYSARDR